MASIPASAIIQEARASLLQPSRPMTPSLRDQRLSPRTKFLRLSTKKTINLSNLPKEKRSLPPLPPPSPSSTNPLLRPNSSVTTGTTDNSSYQNLLNAIEEWPLVTDPIDHYMSHIHSPIHHFMTADSDVMSRASQGLDSLLSNSSMDSTLRLLSGLCLLQINGSGNVERVCQIVAELTGELLANGDEEEDEDEKLEAVFGDARGIGNVFI